MGIRPSNNTKLTVSTSRVEKIANVDKIQKGFAEMDNVAIMDNNQTRGKEARGV
jgi:hypothetical protein